MTKENFEIKDLTDFEYMLLCRKIPTLQDTKKDIEKERTKMKNIKLPTEE